MEKAKKAKPAEKKTAKTSKPVKAEKKVEKSPDMIASEKYQNAKRSTGKGKLYEIYMAGLRRGKNLKK